MLSPRRPSVHLVAAGVLVLGLAAACTTKAHGNGTGQSSPGGSRSATSSATSSPGSPTPSPSSSTVAFSDCANLFNLSAAGIPKKRREKLSFDCGRLRVPIDYARPAGPSISIEVIRIHYRDQPDRIGSLLVNPGGPGASGVVLGINLAAIVSDDVLQHFDIVGFDPRGVGLSSPIRCQTDAAETQSLALDVDIRTPAGRSQAKGVAATFATSCKRKYGAQLAHYNTVESAKDMDRVRAAVGDEKLNYLGFSYGTELGAVYAHLFPTRIRVAVLDGAVDPRTTGNAITSGEQQLGGFESAFDQFAIDCARRTTCQPLGDARRAVETLERTANATPIPSSDRGEQRRATGGNVLYAVISALYSQQLWPALASALIDAQHGDAKGLFQLDDRYSERDPDGHYSNTLDVFQAVSCNDQAVDPTDAVIRATATRWARKFPMFGLWIASSLFQCQTWPKARHPIPPETAARSKPILVVGNLHDPATPYAGAIHLASTLRTGVLLTWNGQGHTSYLQSACIDEKVNAYLIEATLPTPNTTCPR